MDRFRPAHESGDAASFSRCRPGSTMILSGVIGTCPSSVELTTNPKSWKSRPTEPTVQPPEAPGWKQFIVCQRIKHARSCRRQRRSEHKEKGGASNRHGNHRLWFRFLLMSRACSVWAINAASGFLILGGHNSPCCEVEGCGGLVRARARSSFRLQGVVI